MSFLRYREESGLCYEGLGLQVMGLEACCGVKCTRDGVDVYALGLDALMELCNYVLAGTYLKHFHMIYNGKIKICQTLFQ